MCCRGLCRPENFNPRSSCEERLLCKFKGERLVLFQSTLLMRGATSPNTLLMATFYISIHAPHARSDSICPVHSVQITYFNPRSSCEERLHGLDSLILLHNFNPRSSCEERRNVLSSQAYHHHFNPRSSCEERRYEVDVMECVVKFQSTLLMRGATPIEPHSWYCANISIHAPHARSDLLYPLSLSDSLYFNPRSSCEERLCDFSCPMSLQNFNPRSSCEERRYPCFLAPSTNNFNPRSSCEERLSVQTFCRVSY